MATPGDKEGLTLKPRGTAGKFQKSLVLKVTGTSKVAVPAPQKRGDKVVLTQKEIEAKDLVAGPAVAVVYAEAGKDGRCCCPPSRTRHRPSEPLTTWPYGQANW